MTCLWARTRFSGSVFPELREAGTGGGVLSGVLLVRMAISVRAASVMMPAVGDFICP